jgi:TonB family protein
MTLTEAVSEPTVESTLQKTSSGKLSFLFVFAALYAAVVSPAQATITRAVAVGFDENLRSKPNALTGDFYGVYVSPQENSEEVEVQLKLSLTGNGSVISAVVEKSSGIARLDDAAIEYAKTEWSYEPKDGEELPKELLLTVKFDLQ